MRDFVTRIDFNRRRLMFGLVAVCLSGLPLQASTPSAGWSEPVAVRKGRTLCVTYRAMLVDDWLVVRADHEKGWHTYAMDNTQRANEKLNGKPLLGVEEPTAIQLLEG